MTEQYEMYVLCQTMLFHHFFVLNPVLLAFLHIVTCAVSFSNRQHYEIDDCLEDNREDY